MIAALILLGVAAGIWATIRIRAVDARTMRLAREALDEGDPWHDSEGAGWSPEAVQALRSDPDSAEWEREVQTP